jgi:hypothetical protein
MRQIKPDLEDLTAQQVHDERRTMLHWFNEATGRL